MRFKLAVESVPALKGAYRTGLRALAKKDRQLITADGNRLTGSVNLDESLKKGEHAQASRWDYGIGYKINNSEVAIWVEVHPASSTDDVKIVAKKLEWLKHFLGLKDASELRAMTLAFFWVATSRVNRLIAEALQRFGSSMQGLKGPMKQLDLSKVVLVHPIERI